MKLVGATNGFIRRPFLVEGLFQGLIAGVVASGLLYLLFTLAVPVWVPQAADLGWPYGEWYYLAGSMVVAALIKIGRASCRARVLVRVGEVGESGRME